MSTSILIIQSSGIHLVQLSSLHLPKLLITYVGIEVFFSTQLLWYQVIYASYTSHLHLRT